MDDIVTRLRITHRSDCKCVGCEAADEIERLRRERDEARHGDSVATATLQGCIEERTTLRAERDEARRRLCLEWTEHGPVRLSKEQIAMRYGWDCFKEVRDE